MKIIPVVMTLSIAAGCVGLDATDVPAPRVTDTQGQLITLAAGHASLQKASAVQAPASVRQRANRTEGRTRQEAVLRSEAVG